MKWKYIIFSFFRKHWLHRALKKSQSKFRKPADGMRWKWETFHPQVCNKRSTRDSDKYQICDDRKQMERYRWHNVFLSDFRNVSNESFLILSICFWKGTNGTYDKVSCQQKFWKEITIDQICEDELLLSCLLWQCCGKWIKFWECLNTLFQYIKTVYQNRIWWKDSNEI